MSKNRLFPENVIKQSADYLFFTYNKNTQILYLVIIAVVIAAFISLFYIKIDIGVGVNGMIKPKGERVMITSPSVGRLSLKNVSENKKVEEGDTLFVIIADNISSQQNALISRKNDLKSMLETLLYYLNIK